MNTAPKLSPRDKLKELLSSAYHHGRNSFHFNTGDQADKFLAALAPPSGEGDDDKRELEELARSGYQMDERGRIHRITTPQSAPVDGDAVQQALLVINDAANDARHRGDYARANALVKARVTLYRASATPPPASQERGAGPTVRLLPKGTVMLGFNPEGELKVDCFEIQHRGNVQIVPVCSAKPLPPDDGEARARKLYEPDDITASPPSSAAECQKCGSNITFGAHDEPGSCAAEQAKPMSIQEMFDAEQAQAGESREARMVVVERDNDGKPTVWCDPEIVDLVTALNAAGIRTVASCSGHGEQHGNIALADGRELLIAPSFDAARSMEADLRRLAGGVTPEMVRRLAIRLCEDEGIEPHELLWQGSPAQPKGEMWCEYTACARDYLISALGAK